MASLLELSHELLHGIIIEGSPTDLSSLSRTCKYLYNYIKENKVLHRDIYIRRYDQPKSDTDWEACTHDLFKLEQILSSPDLKVKRDALGFAATQINYLLQSSATDPGSSLNIQLLTEQFADTANIDALLCSSALFARAGGETQVPAMTEELRQLSAQLHCMYGVPIDEIPSRSSFHIWRPDVQLSPSACTRLQSRPRVTHTYARAKVYDLRQYTDATLWGPFRDDGTQRVDWEKVEAIMIVLGFNLRKFTDRTDGRFPFIWAEPFAAATPDSFESHPLDIVPSVAKDLDEHQVKIRELALSLDAQDPYGVTGTWMRVVCFLDYNDLYAFNFPRGQPTSPGALREPIDTEEAIRLIRVSWHVTKIELPHSRRGEDDEDDDDLDWSNFQGERLPIIHFAGTSRSLHASWDQNANSRIRGTVRQTPEGQIRWTTFSIFHGEERWRSEGIQVGGLRSARGVLGNWFDKDFDIHGPAGPTAFWKESDQMEDENANSTPLAF
ncbi:hypothetical protein Q7P37_006787 [Cladosporium fusiforme]